MEELPNIDIVNFLLAYRDVQQMSQEGYLPLLQKAFMFMTEPQHSALRIKFAKRNLRDAATSLREHAARSITFAEELERLEKKVN